ncbi:MAG: DUF4280 domain-containing protein [Bacteroidota bacterium]
MASVKDLIVNGDLLKCDQGKSTGAEIAVTSNQKVKRNGKAVANADDDTAIVNIPVFGECKILTASAGTSVTCSHQIEQSDWVNQSPNVKVKTHKALLKSSKLSCLVGGFITYTTKT